MHGSSGCKLPARHQVEEARHNLIEAIELFFETASPSEIRERTHNEVFATQVGVAIA
jgi:predicted RNase H-like HicB family nuclease